jgi:hypothetical protein
MPLLSEDIKPATDIIRKSPCSIDLSDCLKQLVFFTEKLLGNTVAVLMSIEVEGVVLKGTKTSDNFSGLGAELPFTAPAEPGAGTYVLTFTYDADGVIQGAPTLTQP